MPGGDQPGDDLADLAGGDLGLIVTGAEPDRAGTAVQLLRPGSSAATKEYGQPGIICAFPLPRPYTWQNIRSGLVTRLAAASC